MNVASRRAEVVGKWRSWLAAGAANRLQNISLQTAVQLPRSRWVPCETYGHQMVNLTGPLLRWSEARDAGCRKRD
eukprot:scaffold1950_cov237-Skeletonema_marinoi.AAC.1